MKKILLLLILISSFMESQAQKDSSSVPPISKQQYLNKSKINNRSAWILLGVGAAMTTGGTIAILNDPDFLDGPAANGPYLLFTMGILTMGGSIPLFIISGNQAHHAATLSAHFSMEKSMVYEGFDDLQNKGFNSSLKMNSNHLNFPALVIRVKFKN